MYSILFMIIFKQIKKNVYALEHTKMGWVCVCVCGYPNFEVNIINVFVECFSHFHSPSLSMLLNTVSNCYIKHWLNYSNYVSLAEHSWYTTIIQLIFIFFLRFCNLKIVFWWLINMHAFNRNKFSISWIYEFFYYTKYIGDNYLIKMW